MEISNKELMELYIKGFTDELNNSFDTTIILKANAYKLGKLHAKLGDDTESIDALSETDIINIIKKI